MSSLVFNVFKAIMVAIVMVVVCTTVMYLQMVYALHGKVETVMTMVREDVVKNNGLTEDGFKMYSSLLSNITAQMNNDAVSAFLIGRSADNIKAPSGGGSGFNLNYKTTNGAAAPDVAGVTYVQDLNVAGGYGDVAIIRLTARINSLSWFFNDNPTNQADQWVDNTLGDTGAAGVRVIVFEYYVPCLKYVN